MRISIELVPRSREALRSQIEEVRAFPAVDTINLPDIPRFPVRSCDACLAARSAVPNVIPHLRALDFELTGALTAVATVEQSGVREVLALTGDDPPEGLTLRGSTPALELISKLRREHPGLAVYAALDPYRQGFRAELAYAGRKLEVGARGLFTQPFFDLRLMEAYAEQLEGVEIFWGVTSVIGERSVNYWRSRNQVVFPRDFEPTLEWNRRFARQALAFARSHGGNIYFMPIRAKISDYLGGII